VEKTGFWHDKVRDGEIEANGGFSFDRGSKIIYQDVIIFIYFK